LVNSSSRQSNYINLIILSNSSAKGCSHFFWTTLYILAEDWAPYSKTLAKRLLCTNKRAFSAQSSHSDCNSVHYCQYCNGSLVCWVS